MQISIVIPTRHRPADLGCAVESVLRQSRLPDQLLIIDQSNDAESRTRVNSLFATAGKRAALVYVHDAGIPGLVAAKKVGVEHSSGDIVMFLEDDIVLEENYVKTLAQGFLDHPEMMGSCGVVTQAASAPGLYCWFFHFFHRGIFFDRRVGIRGNPNISRNGMIPSVFLSGGISAYRRTVFEKVLFDTANDFFMLEDIDFSTRAARVFGKDHFCINTGARLQHLMSPVNRARLRIRYERKIREFICFYKKNRDQQLSLMNLSWLFIGLFLEALFVSLTSGHYGPISGFFKGLITGFRWRIKPVL
jgi:glucosyl-dolichyl phosphate glucuronosyltransferase